ncbi:MAG: dienelactone hydrolase family protein [Gammaproteobacteria bacterium]|jgi:carboxymethylenebutenolidase|nr:dienelactone hydrolase family protein [Gammaproteobacteria bacterium]
MSRAILIALILAAPPVFAGGHDTATNEQNTAHAHADDKPVATPAATLAPAQPVNSRAAIYTTIEGEEVTGWLAWPAGQSTADLPGLIVIHEWWGLNDNIRQAAERLAGEGYVALAVDLYRGESGANPKDAMRLMQSLNQAETQGRDNLAAAYDYLTTVSGAGKVGVIGWCLGGRWSLQAALRLPTQLDAAVIYYGNVIADKAQLDTLQMPILGLFAGVDPVVPRDSVLAFEQALRELGKQVDIHIYPDAQHAFSNPSGMAYDPAAAADAWDKTTAFLAAHLQ